MNPDLLPRLLAAGLSPPEAERKAELFRLAEDLLRDRGQPENSTWIRCFVPGRIEVLGKHTDYAGGRSLLCAAERGICAVAAPQPDSTIRIADSLRKQECEFSISPDLDPRADHWPIYPRTVARRLARNFPGPLQGLDVAFASDLPRASGMSSSSALLICSYLLLERRNDLRRRPEFETNIHSREEEAAYLGCVENGQTFGTLAGDAGVGTFGGSEDHTAILCCRPGSLSQYRFCPTRFEGEAPLPPAYTFVIAVSGVAADKTGAAREQYNRASGLAREILNIWRAASGRDDPTLFAASTHSVDAPQKIREALKGRVASAYSAEALLDRFDQFVAESTLLVPGAAAALRANLMDALARYVGWSQLLGQERLGNQIPQTMGLAQSAQRLGAIAASAFGAGFGGSVWALTRAEEASEFMTRWQEHYRGKFPAESEKSSFFITGAGPAAFVF